MVLFYILLVLALAGVGFLMWKLDILHVSTFAALVIVGLLIPTPVYAITTSIAKNDQQTYHEYWNGYEVAATTSVQACERDGSCDNTYSCDPYTVIEMETYTDSKGNMQTRSVTRTKYHSCPYSSEETTYIISTTLGGYTAGDSLMTGAPFRSGEQIPGGQVTSPPVLWAEADARVKAGQPGGVTQVNDYKNFILGSERSLFKKYSDKIDQYKADGLLPAPAAGVTNLYQGGKAHFVGNLGKNVDTAALAADVQNLNGAVGIELRGDFHVVFVQASKVDSPEDYMNSLSAYWQSKEFGRDAIAKNSVVVVVGVEPYKAPKVISAPVEPQPAATETVTPPVDSVRVVPPVEAETATVEPVIARGTPVVTWSKAFTGMPLGNERLLTQFSSELPGTVVDNQFVGSPTYDVNTEKVIHTDGALESILYGSNKFERVSMSAADADDSGSGFAYLADEWTPDTGTLVWFYTISSLLFLGACVGGMYGAAALRSNRMADPLAHLFRKAHK